MSLPAETLRTADALEVAIDNLIVDKCKLRELQVAIESLKIKWYKRGKTLTTWDEALEELEEM